MMNLRVQDRLAAGKPAFGTFVKLASPTLIELIGLAGFDFVILDCEHGCFTHEQVENLVRTAQAIGIGAIVRTPDARESAILHALDSGASGVQIPALRSAREAEAAVRHAKYFPLGERGFARACRAGDYGARPLDAYLADANRSLVIAHVENREMVEGIEALCATPGIDVVFLGNADLSQSLGVPGQLSHPLVRAACDRVVAAALDAGRQIGAVVSSAAELDSLASLGINYLVWQSDIAMLRGALNGSAQHFSQYR